MDDPSSAPAPRMSTGNKLDRVAGAVVWAVFAATLTAMLAM